MTARARPRAAWIVTALAAALTPVLCAGAQAQEPLKCQVLCWTLRLHIADLPDGEKLSAYSFKVTAGADDRAVMLAPQGAALIASLPRVMSTDTGKTALRIELDHAGDPPVVLNLEAPGYVRTGTPIDIPFFVDELPAIYNSVQDLDTAIAPPGTPAATLWKVYFQSQALFPDVYGNPVLRPKLARVIFTACARLALTAPTFVLFRVAANNCHQDDADASDRDRDNVNIAPWLLYKYSADPLDDLGNAKTHAAEYGGIYRTLQWLGDLRQRDDMQEQISKHITLNRGTSAPVPTERDFNAVLAKARCRATQACQPG